MNNLQTYDDFYSVIYALAERYEKNTRSLEEYLRALLGLTQKYQHQSTIPIREFITLLEEAFTATPVSFDPTWQSDYQFHVEEANDFPSWQTTIITQIIDLREMKEEWDTNGYPSWYEYNPIYAPRGASWYNLNTYMYLECAAAGTRSQERFNIDKNTPSIQQINWYGFTEFLLLGQYYE